MLLLTLRKIRLTLKNIIIIPTIQKGKDNISAISSVRDKDRLPRAIIIEEACSFCSW
ncbi:MAG: hypothetical protein K0R34_180 [Herbinix sp.]|jgi:hypothetical protein|nr:hypothetical protein [Herbinix sp.]